LRRDGIEKLGTDGDTDIGQVTEKLSSHSETLVNLVGTINILQEGGLSKNRGKKRKMG
jgi:hypothetical protein